MISRDISMKLIRLKMKIASEIFQFLLSFLWQVFGRGFVLRVFLRPPTLWVCASLLKLGLLVWWPACWNATQIEHRILQIFAIKSVPEAHVLFDHKEFEWLSHNGHWMLVCSRFGVSVLDVFSVVESSLRCEYP